MPMKAASKLSGNIDDLDGVTKAAILLLMNGCAGVAQILTGVVAMTKLPVAVSLTGGLVLSVPLLPLLPSLDSSC